MYGKAKNTHKPYNASELSRLKAAAKAAAQASARVLARTSRLWRLLRRARAREQRRRFAKGDSCPYSHEEAPEASLGGQEGRPQDHRTKSGGTDRRTGTRTPSRAPTAPRRRNRGAPGPPCSTQDARSWQQGIFTPETPRVSRTWKSGSSGGVRSRTAQQTKIPDLACFLPRSFLQAG